MTANYTVNGTPAYTYDQLSVEAQEQAHIDSITPEFFEWGVERAKKEAYKIFEDYLATLARNEEDSATEALIKSTFATLYCDGNVWTAEITSDLDAESAAYQALKAKAETIEQIAADLEEQYASLGSWEEYDQHRDQFLYSEDGERLGRLDEADKA